MSAESINQTAGGLGSRAPACSRCGQASCRQCATCGEMECDHHDFVAVVRPKGCACNALEWGKPEAIPPICEEFRGDEAGNCVRCEHDLECHANA